MALKLALKAMILAMMALRHVEVPCDQRLAWIAMSWAGIIRRLAGMGRRHVGKALRLTEGGP